MRVRAHPLRRAQITCGSFHTIAVTVSGEMHACGGGLYGKLGVGDATNRPVPMAVVANVQGRRVTQVRAVRVRVRASGQHPPTTHGSFPFPQAQVGPFHSVAISADGELFAWGFGGSGRLGHGDSESRQVPTPVVLMRSRGITGARAVRAPCVRRGWVEGEGGAHLTLLAGMGSAHSGEASVRTHGHVVRQLKVRARTRTRTHTHADARAHGGGAAAKERDGAVGRRAAHGGRHPRRHGAGVGGGGGGAAGCPDDGRQPHSAGGEGERATWNAHTHSHTHVRARAAGARRAVWPARRVRVVRRAAHAGVHRDGRAVRVGQQRAGAAGHRLGGRQEVHEAGAGDAADRKARVQRGGGREPQVGGVRARAPRHGLR